MDDKIQDLIAETEAARKRMHELIDRNYDDILHMIKTNKPPEPQPVSLSANSSYFKGTKPKELIFHDGHIVQVGTWREVVKVLINDCNCKKHNEMLYLCDKIFGRSRLILSSKSDGLNVPLKVDDDIYFEGFFSTESILDVLKKKLFSAVGYDYCGIMIRLRK